MTTCCADIVCHSFLHKCSEEQRAALLAFLPEEDAKSLETLQVAEKDLSLGFTSAQEDLINIHFSWFEAYLRTLPETEIRLFLSSLAPHQIEGLRDRLLFSEILPAISSMGQIFLQKTLFTAISSPDILPLDCLPKHPLNALAGLDHASLLSLIRLLSMHDLSVEIRHIINTVKLKKIYSILSKPETTYLKTLSHKKEPIVFKALSLSQWSGDTALLQSLLLQRGLNRLAKALFPCHPSLLWYVSHHLDIEKGLRTQMLCTALDHPQAAHLLGKQILDILEAQDQQL